MLRLRRAAGSFCGQIAFTESATKKFQRHLVALHRQGGIVTMAFVAEKGVLAVELVPGEVRVQITERVVNLLPTFQWNVRVLLAPEHQQFSLDVLRTGQRIVAGLAEGFLVKVGGVKANSGEHVRILRCGAKTEMTTDANAKRAKFPGAARMRLEVIQHRAGIAVHAAQFFFQFERVAAIRTTLIVGEDAASRLKLMPDFGHGNDISVACEQSGGAADRSGGLKNFRVKQDAGITPLSLRAENESPHWAGGSGEVNEFGVFDRHGAARLICRGVNTIRI